MYKVNAQNLTKITENRYSSICEIGSGGNGKVFLVKDNNTAQQFALKVLIISSSEKRYRFRSEISVVLNNASSVDGIIPVLDFSAEKYWYTMPVAKPIMQHINETSATAENIVSGVIQLAITLSQLHERGISHRDIKPANIFWYQDRYYLGDFGLAFLPDKSKHYTRSNKALGAIFTIAPEMKRDPKHADGKKADVFSLAKTLWMLLAKDDKGFDGTYNPFDRSHSLRYKEKLANLHLVELEELLAAATNNDPTLRPDMGSFCNSLTEWLYIKRDHERSQVSEWGFITKYLFRENIPESTSWSDRETIIRILNAISTVRAFNHMLFPDGGGLDFQSAKLTGETDCICIYDTLKLAHIIKPKHLHFEIFGLDPRWSYFFLELSPLSPILPDENASEYLEWLEEDMPGHYVSSIDSVYGVYDYDTGIPLPPQHRSVIRYLRGNILIVLKESPYNGIPQTYDGRQSMCDHVTFRKYMEWLKASYDSLIANGFSEEIVLHSIGKNPFKMDTEVHPDPSPSLRLPDDFIENNILSWSFEEFLKPSSEGNIAFSFLFKIRNGGSFKYVLEHSGLYLCTDGLIRENPAKEMIYITHNREDAILLKDLCYQHICALCKNSGFDCPDPNETHFDVCLERTGKPTHLFTKVEIEHLMRSADDRQRNMLVIDENGYASIIQDTVLGLLYPVRHEAWDSRNNYVGKYSSLSSLEDIYLSSLQAWLLYLETNQHQYVDNVKSDRDVNALIKEINQFY